MKELIYYFGVPNGAVWSNVLAEPLIVVLTGLAVLLFRKRLSKLLGKWRLAHHQHLKDHITKEIDQLRRELLKERDHG